MWTQLLKRRISIESGTNIYKQPEHFPVVRIRHRLNKLRIKRPDGEKVVYNRYTICVNFKWWKKSENVIYGNSDILLLNDSVLKISEK